MKTYLLQLTRTPSRIGVALVDLYRATLGVITGGQCRFHPSCSIYAREALLKYGLIRGGMKAIWRIIRCNPLNAGGIDEP